MTAVGPEPNWLPYVGSAVFLVGIAWAAMRWMRRTVEKDLNLANSGRPRPSTSLTADVASPTLVKDALAQGLVSASQLATMSPVERQFLFAQLAPRLSGAQVARTSGAQVAMAAGAPVATTTDVPQLRSTQAITIIPGKPPRLPPLTPEQLAALGPPPVARASGATPAVDAANAAPRVFCPCCGTALAMPASPPFATFCSACGAKTAVRTEEQGRLVINTAPPGVTRPPVG